MGFNFDTYKKRFTDKAINNGFSQENINKCLSYAEPIINKGLPIIYNTSHLSALVGYNKLYLKRAAKFTKYFYRHFTIPKKNKKERQISEPLPSLKEIQNWILNEILYKVRVSKYAKAYIHGRSIKDHVRYHDNEPAVLTLDIKDFFGKIKFEYVESVFLKMGYSKLLSNLFAKLCCLDNKLPQGAPTSPYITNIIMLDFDEVIASYCRKQKIKYTRYADDLAFSGKLKKDEIIDLVTSELNKLELNINVKKVHFMKSTQRQIISGIIVNKRVQVPKTKRNDIRNIMYFIKKYGISDHLKRINGNRANYLKHLIGQVNYIVTINPKDEEFLEYKKILRTTRCAF